MELDNHRVATMREEFSQGVSTGIDIFSRGLRRNWMVTSSTSTSPQIHILYEGERAASRRQNLEVIEANVMVMGQITATHHLMGTARCPQPPYLVTIR